MILSKLNLTEQTDMAFGLNVFGTSEAATVARFVIEGPEFDIACKCVIENGEIKATIPKLKGILSSGLYEARLDVVVGDKLFSPLREQIELNPLIEFDVKTKKVEAIKEGVTITVKTPTESSDTKVSKKDAVRESVIAEGYEITKVKGFEVLKKGSLYFGILNESNVVKSKNGHKSLSSLVEELSK